MKYVIIQIAAMVLMAVATATGIRMILDPARAAWLAWLPNLGLRLVACALLIAIGVALTAWANQRAAPGGPS